MPEEMEQSQLVGKSMKRNNFHQGKKESVLNLTFEYCQFIESFPFLENSKEISKAMESSLFKSTGK